MIISCKISLATYCNGDIYVPTYLIAKHFVLVYLKCMHVVCCNVSRTLHISNSVPVLCYYTTRDVSNIFAMLNAAVQFILLYVILPYIYCNYKDKLLMEIIVKSV